MMQVLHDRIHSRGLVGPGPEGLIWLFALPFSMDDAPVPFLVQLPSVPLSSGYQNRRLSLGAGADALETDAGPARVAHRQAQFHISMHRSLSQHGHQQQQQAASPFAQRSAPGSPSSPAAGHRMTGLLGASAASGGTHLHPGQRCLDHYEQDFQHHVLRTSSTQRQRSFRGDPAEPIDAGSMQGSGGVEREGEQQQQQQQQLPGSCRPPRSAAHCSRHVSENADETWSSSVDSPRVHLDPAAHSLGPYQQDASVQHDYSHQDSAAYGRDQEALFSPSSSAHPPMHAHGMAGSARQLRTAPQHSSQPWESPGGASHMQRQGHTTFECSAPALHQRQHAPQHQPLVHLQQQSHAQQQPHTDVRPASHLFSAVRRLNLAGPSGVQSWSPTPHGSPSALGVPDPVLAPLHATLHSKLQHAGSAPEHLQPLQLGLGLAEEQRVPRRRSSLVGGGYRLSASLPTSDCSSPEASPKEASRPASLLRGVRTAEQLEQLQRQLSPEASPAGHRRAPACLAAQRQPEHEEVHVQHAPGVLSPGGGQELAPGCGQLVFCHCEHTHVGQNMGKLSK